MSPIFQNLRRKIVALALSIALAPTPALTQTWKGEVLRRAKAEGVSSETVGIVLQHRSYEARYTMPETNAPLHEMGQEIVRNQGSFLDKIEEEYGVSRQILLGILAVETNMGQNIGQYSVPEALTRMADNGRRRNLAIEQFVELARLVENNEIQLSDLVGSSAGAMGLTQFMPASYSRFAVDGDGDGKRDLWQLEDALASTANYLAKHGWERDQPWGIEVRKAHDDGALDVGIAPVKSWRALGYTTRDGFEIPDFGDGRLVRFGGVTYLVFGNFDVLLSYNYSSRYALQVGVAGNCIVGRYDYHRDPVTPYGPEIRFGLIPDSSNVCLSYKGSNTTRAANMNVEIPGAVDASGAAQNVTAKAEAPRPVAPVVVYNGLTRDEMLEIQRRLKRAGFNLQSVDGVYGRETHLAVARFQYYLKMDVTGKPSRSVLKRLRASGIGS